MTAIYQAFHAVIGRKGRAKLAIKNFQELCCILVLHLIKLTQKGFLAY